jgi:hypothetical protein
MREKKTGDYVGAVVANVIVLVFVNTLLLWRQSTQGIVLESWADVLWALDASLGAQIAGNFLLCFYRPQWFSAIIRAFLAAAGLMSIIVFYVVFPLDFSHVVGAWLNALMKIVLIVGMAGSVIGIVIELVRFIQAAGRAVSGKA